MTKTITKTTLAALALGAAMPAMAATDGSPGATSTGSFDMAITINPPAASTVHIIGLDDVDFGSVTTSNTGTTPVATLNRKFCLNRSDPGNVRVTSSQVGVAPGFAHRVSNGTNIILMATVIQNPNNGSAAAMNNEQTEVFQASGPGCTASSTGPEAHTLAISTLSDLPSYATTALSGTFTGTVTVTVALD